MHKIHCNDEEIREYIVKKDYIFQYKGKQIQKYRAVMLFFNRFRRFRFFRKQKNILLYFCVYAIVVIGLFAAIFQIYQNMRQANAAGGTIDFSFSSVRMLENNANPTVSVKTSLVSTDPAPSVTATITGGNAVIGKDFTFGIDGTSSKVITVPLGQDSAVLPLKIIDNTKLEDNRTIQITLSNPVNTTLGSNNVLTYTILDDDASYEPLGSDPTSLPNFDYTNINTLNVTEGLKLQLDAQTLTASNQVVDPNNILALHADGVDGATSTTDVSPTPKTLTFNGGAQISTTQSKFGGSSLKFDGDGDSVSLPTSNFSIDSNNNWTIEYWQNLTADTGVSFTGYNLPGNQSNRLIFYASQFGTDAAAINIAPTTLNQWVHVAVTYNATTDLMSVYYDGILQGTQTISTIIDSTNNYFFGGSPGDNNLGSAWFNGSLDDIRMSNTIRYTADFTPPTAAFTDTVAAANVSTWADNSGNGNDATQATTVNQPIVVDNALNGKKVVRFDGVNDGLESTFVLNPNTNKDTTVYAVEKVNQAPSQYVSVWSTDSTIGGYKRGHGYDASSFYTQTGNSSSYNPPVGLAVGSARIVGTEYNNSQGNIYNYINGTKYSRGSAETIQDTNNPFWIGMGYNGGQNFNGDIAEVLVYNRTLNDTERKQVECYLSNKYGLNVGGCTDGKVLWLDAGTINGNNGDAVTSWADQSGLNNNGVGTATLKTGTNGINNKKVVSFNGSNNEMSFSSFPTLGNSTIFSIIKPTGDLLYDGVFTTNGMGIVGSGNSGNGTQRFGFLNGNNQTVQTNSTVVNNGTQSYLIAGKLEGTTQSLYLNGNNDQVNYSNGGWGITGTRIGKGYYNFYLNADVAETIVYNRALNDTERKQVECYLSKKYNLNAAGCEGSTKLWLDANSISGNDGDSIDTWSDSTGNGNSATGSGSTRPILKKGTNGMNGQNTVRFDGSDDFLSTNYLVPAGNKTLYQVMRFSSLTGPAGFALSGTQQVNAYLYAGVQGSNSKPYAAYGNNSSLVGTTNLSTNQGYILGVLGGDASSRLRVNGNQEATASGLSNTNASVGFLVGKVAGTHNVNGDIAEVLVLNTALNTPQRTIYENYLAQKYGITIGNSKYAQASASNQIVGIGSESDGIVSRSGSSSGFYINDTGNNATATLNLGEYVLAGNDGGSNTISYSNTTGSVTSRWNKMT